jgi:LmbE family N-acetylglucosaminyl deacetylase
MDDITYRSKKMFLSVAYSHFDHKMLSKASSEACATMNHGWRIRDLNSANTSTPRSRLRFYIMLG